MKPLIHLYPRKRTNIMKLLKTTRIKMKRKERRKMGSQKKPF